MSIVFLLEPSNPEKPMPFPGFELQIVPYPSDDIDLVIYCNRPTEFL